MENKLESNKAVKDNLKCGKQCHICYNDVCKYRTKEPTLSEKEAVEKLTELSNKMNDFYKSNDSNKVKTIFSKYKTPFGITRQDRRIVKKLITKHGIDTNLIPYLMMSMYNNK